MWPIPLQFFFPTRNSSEVHQGTALRMQDTTVISSAISKSSKNLPRSPESIPSVLRRSRHGPSPHSSTKKKRRRFRNTTWGRWIKTVLVWQPRGHKRIGRPKCCWDSMTTNFWRLINFPIVQLILVYGVKPVQTLEFCRPKCIQELVSQFFRCA